jgi:hypothetical protein
MISSCKKNSLGILFKYYTTEYHSMCEFISDYEYSKLFKRRMDKLAEEEEEQQPELEKVEEQPLVASK